MKLLGWLLVASGFLWLCATPVLLRAQRLNAHSDLIYLIEEKKPALSKEELRQNLDQVFRKLRDHQPAIRTPACLMLVGALLIGPGSRFKLRRHSQAQP